MTIAAPRKARPDAVPATDLERIARAIAFAGARYPAQPSVAEMARAAGLAPTRFARAFRAHAGVTPKSWVQHLTLADARERLATSSTVLEASYAVGLSGPSRLHDLFTTTERMTPGQYRAGGRGVRIAWSVTATPFGTALLAATERGVCALAFLDDAPREPALDAALEDLRARWPRAAIGRDDAGLSATAAEIARRLAGGRREPLALLLAGTPFEMQVWEALLRLPAGQMTSYGTIASALGAPAAARAVGQAVGANPIAALIPCHRVLRANGALGGYRWGEPRKRALLAAESARR
jgi:AraC family transcriptional regulator of adaptative response/methylated-DNA-[protein]-cysteine methyltransferase